MACFIAWCTQFQVLIFIVLSGAGIAVAIIIPLYIAKKQNKISLLEERHKFIKELNYFVETVLPTWDLEPKDITFVEKYSKLEVQALFNKDVAAFWEYLNQKCCEVNSLWGDYEYAKRKDYCRGRDCDEIESETKEICIDVQKRLEILELNLQRRFL